MRRTLIIAATLALTACQNATTTAGKVTTVKSVSHAHVGRHTRGRVVGKTRGLHPRLMSKLRGLSKAMGRKIVVTSGCRKHGSRRAPKSFHRRRAGCRAADIHWPRGKSRPIAWWKRNNRTWGIGTYRHRPSMLHLDVRPFTKDRWYWR